MSKLLRPKIQNSVAMTTGVLTQQLDGEKLHLVMVMLG